MGLHGGQGRVRRRQRRLRPRRVLAGRGLPRGLAGALAGGMSTRLAGRRAARLLGGWGQRHGRDGRRGRGLRARGESGAGAAALERRLQRRRRHLRTGVFRHHRLKYWVFAAVVLALLLAPF